MPSTENLLTPAARRHIWRMLRALAPSALKLDHACETLLRARHYGPAQVRALLAISPAAASRLRTLKQFMEQVAYSGRRLARLNVPPSEVNDVLREVGVLAGRLLSGGFEPAREQLYLASILTLNEAYYQVRESEAQTFFGLHRAETHAAGLDDLLKRHVRILTQSFGAQAGRVLLLERPATGKLARPRYIEHGQPDERLICDGAMRSRYVSYWSYPISPVAVIQFGFP